MGAMSRQKGKIGEREFRDVLRERGHVGARRGQQYSGTETSADVVCKDCVHCADVHWEVKRKESMNLYDALEQAIADAGGKTPIVAHRRNNRGWVAVLRMEDLLLLLERADHSTIPRTGNL